MGAGVPHTLEKFVGIERFSAAAYVVVLSAFLLVAAYMVLARL
jgi:hypothetical protein